MVFARCDLSSEDWWTATSLLFGLGLFSFSVSLQPTLHNSRNRWWNDPSPDRCDSLEKTLAKFKVKRIINGHVPNYPSNTPNWYRCNGQRIDIDWGMAFSRIKHPNPTIAVGWEPNAILVIEPNDKIRLTFRYLEEELSKYGSLRLEEFIDQFDKYGRPAFISVRNSAGEYLTPPLGENSNAKFHVPKELSPPHLFRAWASLIP